MYTVINPGNALFPLLVENYKAILKSFCDNNVKDNQGNTNKIDYNNNDYNDGKDDDEN